MIVAQSQLYNIVALNGIAGPFPCGGCETVGMQIIGHGWTGTLTFQTTVDGTTWRTQRVFLASSTSATTGVTTVAADDIAVCDVSGVQSIRVTATAYTAGNIDVIFLGKLHVK